MDLVDARLQAGLRSALAGYQEKVDAAQSAASLLARNRTFQLELESSDAPGLTRLLRDTTNIYVVAAGNTFHVGRRPGLAVERQVAVITRRGLVGTVAGFVPLDTSLVDAVPLRSGFAPPHRLVFLYLATGFAGPAQLSVVPRAAARAVG